MIDEDKGEYGSHGRPEESRVCRENLFVTIFWLNKQCLVYSLLQGCHSRQATTRNPTVIRISLTNRPICSYGYSPIITKTASLIV